jgi:hypothetical protein
MSSGDRTQRLKHLYDARSLQRGMPKDHNNTTRGFQLSAIAGTILTNELGCCEPPAPIGPVYYTVTAPVRAGTPGFDLSGAFTIEWYQTILQDSPFPRVFSIGSFEDTSGATFAVSIEDASLIVWMNGLQKPDPPATIYVNSVYGQQAHIAVERDVSGLVSVYVNGNDEGQQFIYNDPIPTGQAPLTIRNESIPSCNTQFYGSLPSFRWVNGRSVYNGLFTPPAMPLQDVSGTVLLINDFPETSGEYNGYIVTANELNCVDEP